MGTLVGVLATGAMVAPGAYAATSTKSTLGPARTIDTGESTRVTGRVTSGGSAVQYSKVVLQYSVGNGWEYQAGGKTASNGKIHFNVHPKRTTFYRMVFPGRGVKSASTSDNVRIRVITDRGAAIVKTAASLKGAPYRYGAAGPRAFDCSGFTQYVFKQHGRSLPHSATEQAKYGKSVAKGSARPGDILLFPNGNRYGHVAIYAGGGQMWDASTSGKPVAKKKIWSNQYVVRRLL
jgi:cell wall-associated NlpC family hydrolase